MKSIFVSTGCTSSDMLVAPVLAELRRTAAMAWPCTAWAEGRSETKACICSTKLPHWPASALSPACVPWFGMGPRPCGCTARLSSIFANPAALALLVDNPGLNLFLMGLARRIAIPVLYYVPPENVEFDSLAHTARLARQAAAIACLFFASEGEGYRASGGNVWSIGHPTVDLLANAQGPRLSTHPLLPLDCFRASTAQARSPGPDAGAARRRGHHPRSISERPLPHLLRERNGGARSETVVYLERPGAIVPSGKPMPCSANAICC